MVNYDKYINRLRAKRMNNPEYAFYRQTMFGMTEPLKRMQNEMQGSMNMAGGSIGARAQAGLSGQQMLQGTASNLYQTADRNAIARNDQLDTQIMTLESQRDEQKAQQKNAGLKSAINIGATALGAGVGALAGNPLIGAQIGSAAGGILGGFVGGGGQMGLAYANPEEIAQGIGDTVAGISAASTLKEHKDMANLIQEKLPALTGENLDKFTMLVTGGFVQEAMALLRGLNVSTGTPIDLSNNAVAGYGV